jgi:hypothetical protein
MRDEKNQPAALQQQKIPAKPASFFSSLIPFSIPSPLSHPRALRMDYF